MDHGSWIMGHGWIGHPQLHMLILLFLFLFSFLFLGIVKHMFYIYIYIYCDLIILPGLLNIEPFNKGSV